jgi:hypothetical protein
VLFPEQKLTSHEKQLRNNVGKMKKNVGGKIAGDSAGQPPAGWSAQGSTRRSNAAGHALS